MKDHYKEMRTFDLDEFEALLDSGELREKTLLKLAMMMKEARETSAPGLHFRVSMVLMTIAGLWAEGGEAGGELDQYLKEFLGE